MRINPVALQVIRVLGGQSQSELARRTGISQSYISELESGDKPGSPAKLLILAKELGVPVAALLREPSDDEVSEAQAQLAARPSTGGRPRKVAA